jgi:excisionase family DNA binding protein
MRKDPHANARLFTVEQASRYMSCPVKTVRSLLFANEMPCLKVGKRYLIDRVDIDLYIESHKQHAGSPLTVASKVC